MKPIMMMVDEGEVTHRVCCLECLIGSIHSTRGRGMPLNSKRLVGPATAHTPSRQQRGWSGSQRVMMISQPVARVHLVFLRPSYSKIGTGRLKEWLGRISSSKTDSVAANGHFCLREPLARIDQLTSEAERKGEMRGVGISIENKA
jgi:hypothetical protein